MTGKVHDQMEGIEMLKEMLCDGGDNMNSVRWRDEAVMVVAIGKERGTGEMNGKDCMKTEKACG